MLGPGDSAIRKAAPANIVKSLIGIMRAAVCRLIIEGRRIPPIAFRFIFCGGS